jgi:uncharacterized membrane protein YdjX (TVP38/TMEM64 family)
LLPKLIAAIGLLIALLLFGREAASRLPTFAAWVHSLGFWGPLAFVVGYGVAATLLIPVVVLTVSAGALWGFRRGVLYVAFGASLGAALAFLAARHVIRRFVEAYVERHPRLAAIDRAVETEGARLVFLLRLSPLVPYVLLNYILGVSRVSFRDYMLGLVGMLPIAAAYVYGGKAAGDIATLAAGVAAPRDATYYWLLALGLAATALASVLVTRAAARAIERRELPVAATEIASRQLADTQTRDVAKRSSDAG